MGKRAPLYYLYYKPIYRPFPIFARCSKKPEHLAGSYQERTRIAKKGKHKETLNVQESRVKKETREFSIRTCGRRQSYLSWAQTDRRNQNYSGVIIAR